MNVRRAGAGPTAGSTTWSRSAPATWQRAGPSAIGCRPSSERAVLPGAQQERSRVAGCGAWSRTSAVPLDAPAEQRDGEVDEPVHAGHDQQVLDRVVARA